MASMTTRQWPGGKSINIQLHQYQRKKHPESSASKHPPYGGVASASKKKKMANRQ